MNSTTKKQVLFTLIFAVLGFAALQIPVTHLAGSKATFTLFDAFSPVAGGFLGSFYGMAAVLLMQLINFLIHGKMVLDAGTIIRFIPPLFGALYFAGKKNINWVIPILAIIAFVINPIGRSVWYYSLFWLIPIATYFFQQKSLVARSLGATFAAHAVGGALWIYFFNLPKSVWISLIPIVAAERLAFAFGTAISYLLLNNILALLVKKQIIPDFLPIAKSLVWKGIYEVR